MAILNNLDSLNEGAIKLLKFIIRYKMTEDPNLITKSTNMINQIKNKYYNELYKTLEIISEI